MIKEKIKAFLKEDPEFGSRFSENISDKTSLIEAGILDSFGIVRLVAYLEENFQIRFEPNDLVEENFASLENIVKCVNQKKNAC